jgi:hypothetical protein
MKRIDPLIPAGARGALLAVPSHSIVTHIHWIKVLPINKNHFVYVPRLCLRQNTHNLERNANPCPFCTHTFNNNSLNFIMYNKFSDGFVGVSHSVAEAIYKRVVSHLDNYFYDAVDDRSTDNVVNITLSGSRGLARRLSSVTPLFSLPCDIEVPSDLYTPLPYDVAKCEADHVMNRIFEQMTPEVQTQLLEHLVRSPWANLNYILDYAKVYYKGWRVIAMHEGEVICDTGTTTKTFDMVDVFHRDSQTLRFEPLNATA